MNKFLSLILILIFFSCKEIESFGFLLFNSEIDTIGIDKILDNKTTHNIEILGSYNYKNTPVVSKFIFKDQYYIHLIKLDSLSDNFKIKTISNTIVLKPGFYDMINDSDYEILYDTRINKSVKAVNKISLISNGKIIKNNCYDSIQHYTIKSNKFYLKINDDDKMTLCGDKMPKKFNITFIKKHKSLYIFILIPFNNEVFDANIFDKLFI